MSPLGRGILALVIALLIAAPALAQSVPSPRPPTPPPEAQCQPPVEQCFPDLLPTNPYVEIRDERYPATVCTDLINLGRGPSATPFRVRMDIDGIPQGERQVSGTYQRGEGESAICWERVAVGRGRHTATIVVDSHQEVIESDEDNNARTISFFVRAEPKTDLRLVEVAVIPRIGGTGDTQIFVVNVTNNGAAPSNGTSVRLFDENGDLATWPVPVLQPGQTITFAHATRPELRPIGTFVAQAIVDPEDLVGELNEENNEAIAEYTVLPHPLPDYTIENVTIVGNLTENRGLKIDVVVKNTGDRAVRGGIVQVLNETGDMVAQRYTRNLIRPNETAAVEFRAALPVGNHTFLVRVDPTFAVVEHNESNNDWPLNLTILPAPLHVEAPNLIVERMFAMPTDPRPGERVSVGALVRNVGVNRSVPTTVNFTVQGKHIGSADVPSLPPGASHTAYVPWTSGGDALYILAAEVDKLGSVKEFDETDNNLSMEFLITTEKPPPEPEEPGPIPPVIVDPPTTPTTPTPSTPTPPVPTTPTPPTPTGPRIVFGEIIASTRSVEGGARGVFSVTVRNPNLQPLGLMTVQFRVDGKLLSEKIVNGLAGAATTAVSTGDIEIPGGKNVMTAEIRILGSTEPAIVREREYDVTPGKKGLPGFEVVALVAALGLALAMRRARRGP